MKSVGAMVKQLEGLIGTSDLNDWETGFVSSIVGRTQRGVDTVRLSPKVIEIIERIYAKHFGDS